MRILTHGEASAKKSVLKLRGEPSVQGRLRWSKVKGDQLWTPCYHGEEVWSRVTVMMG
jgi:hypothetical protein